MEIALGLPNGSAGGSAADLLGWAARAEEGPFSGVAVLDRVVAAGYEPLAVLAALAGATRRVRLIASVVVAPTRETTLLARQAATIDAVSGGRLSLGVGVGVRPEDYRATGHDFHARGARLDDQLATLRRLWAGEPLGDGIGPIGAPPPGPGRPELLVGGYVPQVARRIAAWGDGFMAPGGGEPAAMAVLWERILDAWAEGGRPGRPRWVGASYFALGPSGPEEARRYIDRMYGHDPALAARRLAAIPTDHRRLRELVHRVAAMGVDELILRPVAPSLDQVERLVDAL